MKVQLTSTALVDAVMARRRMRIVDFFLDDLWEEKH
jgi:hypothetical protein